MDESKIDSIDVNLKYHTVAVIPCYNTGDRARKTLERTLTFLDRVILVDDGSTDGCTDALESLPIIKIGFSRNRGKGYALIEGIRHALSLSDVDAVVLLDADGQHDPGELSSLYDAYKSRKADLVIGARMLDSTKTPWRSRIGNLVTAWVVKRFFHSPLTDTQCGFRMLSPRFASLFCDTIAGGRYETEMLMILLAINSGCTLLSVPISTIYEPGNRSSHFRKVHDSFRIYAALWKVLRNPEAIPPKDPMIR